MKLPVYNENNELTWVDREDYVLMRSEQFQQKFGDSYSPSNIERILCLILAGDKIDPKASEDFKSVWDLVCVDVGMSRERNKPQISEADLNQLSIIESATAPFQPSEALAVILKHFDLGDRFTQCIPKEGTSDAQLGRGVAGMMLVDDLAKFGLGDIILELERRNYPDAIAQICSALNREDAYQTLSKYKRTSERTPPKLRGKPNLAFTHYAEITNAKKGSVPIEELIERASAECWNLNQIREEVRKAQNKPEKLEKIHYPSRKFLCIPLDSPKTTYSTNIEPLEQENLHVIRLDSFDYACQWEVKDEHFVHNWCPVPHDHVVIEENQQEEVLEFI